MSLPFVSILIPTFGRVALLEEALASAINQDYPGSWEIVVLNSYQGHHLLCRHPQVKVINTTDRPPLGEIRNRLVQASSADWLLNLDDDDMFRRHYLRMCVEEAVLHTWEWAQVGGAIHTLDRKLNGFIGPTGNQMIFTRSAWTKAGGYRPLHTAEDAAFHKSLQEHGVVGGRIDKPLGQYGVFFGWGSHGGKVLHTSEGHPGSDPEQMYQHVKSLESEEKRVIDLHPHLKRDYEAEFLAWLPHSI